MLDHPHPTAPSWCTIPFKRALLTLRGCPDSSVDKEFAYKAEDPDSWVKKPDGKGRGYPLQYFWASLVAQLVKNLPAMQETPV